MLFRSEENKLKSVMIAQIGRPKVKTEKILEFKSTNKSIESLIKKKNWN